MAKKFQGLIDEYNAGSQNIEAFFEELKKFARNLTAEEQRSIAEGLTEEELALFDILTKPEPALTKVEEAEVKKVCRELLATLKREKLVLDWREKQQAKAGVMQTLRMEFRRLPSQVYESAARREDGHGVCPCVRPLRRCRAERVRLDRWTSDVNLNSIYTD